MVDVEVEFRGLCLFYVDPGDPTRVKVAMPDARNGQTQPDGRPLSNPPGDWHVGYLSCQANLDGVDGVGEKDEFVHRFDAETLHFGAAEPGDGTHDINVPNFRCLADGLRPVDDLFSDAPPAGVLMWTALEGGRLSSDRGAFYSDFEVEPVNAQGESAPPGGGTPGICGAEYADSVTWKATIKADYLTLQFVPWDRRRPPTTVRLRPGKEGGAVKIRVANLCSDNPLRWTGELRPCRDVGDRYDVDFRWLYRLLGPDDELEALRARAKDKDVDPAPRFQRRDASRTCPPLCKPGKIAPPT